MKIIFFSKQINFLIYLLFLIFIIGLLSIQTDVMAQVENPSDMIDEKYNSPECESLFGNKFFDTSIPSPIGKIQLGELTCKKIDFYRWFISIEDDGTGNFTLTGIKLWTFFIGFIAFILTMIHMITRGTTKILKQEKK